MVAKVVRQSNELKKCLLSFWQWEVKNLETLLFGFEVPVLDIRCPAYSTSLRPSLVLAGLAVTLSFHEAFQVPCEYYLGIHCP